MKLLAFQTLAQAPRFSSQASRDITGSRTLLPSDHSYLEDSWAILPTSPWKN